MKAVARPNASPSNLRRTVVLLISMLICSVVAFAQASEQAASATANSGRVRMYKMKPKHGVDKVTGGPIPYASSPSGAHLTYYGGRVVSSMQVVIVLYGSGAYESHISSTGSPSMASFYEQVLSQSTYSSWLDGLYNTVLTGGTQQHIIDGQFQQLVTITPSSANNGSTISDAQIQSEIEAQIAAGHVPAPQVDAQGNAITYYAIFFPPGKTITQGGNSSCVSGGFCAYHGTVAASGSLDEFYYGVHPDMQAGSGCATGCGTSTVFDNYTSVASHEMTETITDAEVGLATVNGPPLAWYDTTNGEIGDICNAEQGTFTACDGSTYTLQLEFSNAAPNGNACQNPATASCGVMSDFSISAGPSSVTVTAGNGGSSTVSTTVIAGSAGTVSLSVSGAPSGVNASLSPTSVTAGGSSTLTITTASTVTPGTYTLTVSGTEGSKTHTATVSLTVNAPPANDFSISASPTSVSIAQGGSGGSTISTAVTSGSAGTVSLSVSGAPSGVTASLSPTSVSAGQSSSLSIGVSSTAAPGGYTLTITGTEGNTTHSATVSLTIPVNDFSISASPTSVSVAQGSNGSSTISTAVASGAAGTVSLSVSGAPSGVTASLSPTSVTAGAGSTLSITASGTTTAGTYTLTVTGTEGSNSHQATVGLTITASDFTLSASPTSVTVNAGSSAGTTISTSTKTGAAETVGFSASGLPSGVMASFNPTSVTSGQSSTLTFTANAGAPSSTSTITVTGTGTSATHTVPVTLTVVGTSGIVNGGFELGSLYGWVATGQAGVSTNAHSGAYAAMLGSMSPTNGTSALSQTFAAPSGTTMLSFYYAMGCPAKAGNSWVTATLTDNTLAKSKTVVAKTCSNGLVWTPAATSIVGGHSYTLTFSNHAQKNAVYSLFDDVTVQ